MDTIIEQHEYHQEVGLNDYERFYFRRYFNDDIKKLEYFRKIISKDQKDGFYGGEPYVVRSFNIKGGKLFHIKISRKKVDAYIREVKEKLHKNEKIG